jgi:DNA-binding beta-propeller fold protein YncE
MNKILKFILLVLIIISCSKIPDATESGVISGNGVFILNEGNFMSGNGSLSFYSYDSSKVINDLFYSVNGRPLGDVPNSLVIYNTRIYIVVNNSGKIEIVDNSTLESKATIKGLISPRNISILNDQKAYITSLYSDSLAIINIPGNTISGYINLRRTSEAISIVGNEAFIANWTGGKEIMVVNTQNDKVVDSIQVGMEPESMVIDKNKKLWVLCNGGWAKQTPAEIAVINTTTHKVEKKFIFPTVQASPVCLQIDGTGDNLYYIDGGVRKMSIGSANLPSNPFIAQGAGEYFYKIAINPDDSDVFITDAADFMHPGYLLLYKYDGSFVSRNHADIIPGSLCFRLSANAKGK